MISQSQNRPGIAPKQHLFRHLRSATTLLSLGALCLGVVLPSGAQEAKSASTAPPKPAVTTEPNDYVIGVEDVIEISAVGLETEVNQTVTVLSTGKVRVKGIDEDIKAEGLTEAELHKIIFKGLDRLYRDLELTVRVVLSRSRNVSILGVRMPGQYPLRKGMHVSSLIAIGGGLPMKPKLCVGTLQRNFKITKLDILKIAGAEPDADADFLLQPGDTIVIDTVEDAPPPSISVLGAVAKPGSFPMPLDGSSITLARAIADAGGPIDKAALTRAYVRRGDKVFPMNLYPLIVEGKTDAPEGRFELKNGDEVLFPVIEAKYMVLGAVTKPSAYPLLDEKPISIARALSEAGGGTALAEMRKAAIMRVVDGRPTTIKIDLQKMLTTGKSPEGLMLQNGDVLYVPTRGKAFSLVEAVQPLTALGFLGLRPF